MQLVLSSKIASAPCLSPNHIVCWHPDILQESQAWQRGRVFCHAQKWRHLQAPFGGIDSFSIFKPTGQEHQHQFWGAQSGLRTLSSLKLCALFYVFFAYWWLDFCRAPQRESPCDLWDNHHLQRSPSAAPGWYLGCPWRQKVNPWIVSVHTCVFEHLGVRVVCLYAPCVKIGCSNPRSIQIKTSVSEANLEEGKVRVQQGA